jgi:hypothetical protein
MVALYELVTASESRILERRCRELFTSWPCPSLALPGISTRPLDWRGPFRDDDKGRNFSSEKIRRADPFKVNQGWR